MNQNRIFRLMLAISFMFITSVVSAKDPSVAFVYLGPVGDGGWTYAHDLGRKHLEKMGVKTAYVENVAEADAERAITRLARRHDIIFTTSFGYMDPTLKVSKKFPKKVFMHNSGYKTSKNMGNYFARMYQARYLVGMIAGTMTKTNRIGIIGSHPIPEILRHINAFTLGARSVNPKATVQVLWVNSWFDPPKEAAATESLIDNGADIVTITTDSPAATQVAQKRGKYAIGNDSDMTLYGPKAHLTANIFNWGIYYEHVYKQVQAGTWKPTSDWWGIETGIIDVSPFASFVPKQLQEDVNAKKQAMIDQKFVVFKGPIKNQAGTLVVKDGQVLTDPEMLAMDYFIEGVIGTVPTK